jgi:hypothetical protein
MNNKVWRGNNARHLLFIIFEMICQQQDNFVLMFLFLFNDIQVLENCSFSSKTLNRGFTPAASAPRYAISMEHV